MRDRMKQPELPGDPSGRAGETRAHEARTQLTVIGAYAQLARRRLRRGTLEADDLDRALARIEHAAARLTRLVGAWEEADQESPDA